MERNDGKKRQRGFGEQIPAEVIGEILSRVEVARDVVRASLTSRKWREAFRKHLHTLSFNVAHDKRVYWDLPTADWDVLIAKTLFQTSGLRKLSILMNKKHKFSSGSVVGWLFFVRETLLELFYMVSTSPSINVLDICGRQRLETLSLCECTINDVDPNFQRFPCLTSLSLSRVSISVEDLNSLLLAFPKLERLELSNPIIRTIDDAVESVDMTIKLCCPTLKSLILKDVNQSKFILENGCIECVDVSYCYFGSFMVCGSKSLRHVKFVRLEAQLLDIEEGDNLEVLEFIACLVNHSNLFPMKIHTPKLRTFRIWGFSDAPYCGFDIDEERRPYAAVDFDQISACSPQLRHLAILFDESDDLDYTFGGLSSLENVVVLEIGWEDFNGFWEWAEKVLKYCPNVRKLVVTGTMPKSQDDEFLEGFSQHNTSMVEMMRKYQHVEVQILYIPLSKFRDSSNYDSRNPLRILSSY